MGAWIEIDIACAALCLYDVAPLVGAWIEIAVPELHHERISSLPSWERGLKCTSTIKQSLNRIVAPLVGAWIEIPECSRVRKMQAVAPLVGAWIEIPVLAGNICSLTVAPLVGAWIEIQQSCLPDPSHASLPSWERGLKLFSINDEPGIIRRSPRGSVD